MCLIYRDTGKDLLCILLSGTKHYNLLASLPTSHLLKTKTSELRCTFSWVHSPVVSDLTTAVLNCKPFLPLVSANPHSSISADPKTPCGAQFLKGLFSKKQNPQN